MLYFFINSALESGSMQFLLRIEVLQLFFPIQTKCWTLCLAQKQALVLVQFILIFFHGFWIFLQIDRSLEQR